jgi:hypothetical protein
VFDNDGTLWCEKPMPIQADFILRRLFEMAQADPELRVRQPWKAAYQRDYGWLGKVLAEHYAGEVYGIARDRVIGSATTFQYTSDDRGGTITHKAEADYLDDGPQKPIRIWSRTGRRPLLAAGNSNGDIPMLEFTHHQDRPVLRLLVFHDDAQREFDYTSGAEQAFEQANIRGWTVVSIKNDWGTVF